MTPTVSRLLRWAAVIGLGITLTLAAWQDPVLAYGTDRPPLDGSVARLSAATALGAVVGFGLMRHRRHRPPRLSRRPVPAGPVSGSRPPGRRRSRR
ncbi:hypothetical protein MRQ36_23500 [Micromonospora sp. R77]|uniref:hypothetical protein n=1 Tax=Micromonospora sp. R77 TaxID=2925836 RepID=UPI001F60C05D|nr:hypothetical protein [Micromonospora sp. R77]MCI4065369.1 hypothetical protein [Micromonospora sp. R77]